MSLPPIALQVERNLTHPTRSSFKPLDYFEVTVEPRLSTAWLVSRATAPVSYTVPVLREFVTFGTQMRSLGTSAPGFVIYGSGRPHVFSLGGHLDYFQSCLAMGDESALFNYASLSIDAVWNAISGFDLDHTVTVAVVQGEALGGGFEAALACNVLVAEKGAVFGFPEALFGLFPGMGGARLMECRGARDLGHALIRNAAKISAEELYEAGVVDYLAPTGQGMEIATEVCQNERSSFIKLRKKRFSKVSKADLRSTARHWAEQAMLLGKKEVKTIGYLSQAQNRLFRLAPSIRVV